MNLIFTLLSFAASVSAASNPYCQNMTLPHGETLNYCVSLPATTATPRRIIYYMHGLGGSARDIFNSELQQGIEELDQNAGAYAPAIVALDFGSSAVITYNGPVARDLATSAIPKIEKELGLNPLTLKRHLMGASLGGFNALNFSASNARLFRSLSALCPAVIDFNPFNSDQADSYIYRNAHADSQAVGMLVNQLRQKFRSEKAWTLNDPLLHVKAGAYDHLDMFVSTGMQDTYGFNEGYRALATDLAARHTSAVRVYSPVNGGHCSFDTSGLLAFLTRELSR